MPAYLLAVALSLVVVEAHSAEACSANWSFQGSIFVLGVDESQACAIEATRLANDGYGDRQGACSVANGVMTEVIANVGQTISIVHLPVGCSALPAPPATPASSPGSVSMDWSNPAHLMQALLVAAVAFSFFGGYRAGDKL